MEHWWEDKGWWMNSWQADMEGLTANGVNEGRRAVLGQKGCTGTPEASGVGEGTSTLRHTTSQHVGRNDYSLRHLHLLQRFLWQHSHWPRPFWTILPRFCTVGPNPLVPKPHVYSSSRVASALTPCGSVSLGRRASGTLYVQQEAEIDQSMPALQKFKIS